MKGPQVLLTYHDEVIGDALAAGGRDSLLCGGMTQYEAVSLTAGGEVSGDNSVEGTVNKSVDVALFRFEHIIKIEIVGSYVNIDYLEIVSKGLAQGLELIGSDNDSDYIYYDINGKVIGRDNLQKDNVYTKVSKKTNAATRFIKK